MTIRYSCDGNCGSCPFGSCPSEGNDSDSEQEKEDSQKNGK